MQANFSGLLMNALNLERGFTFLYPEYLSPQDCISETPRRQYLAHSITLIHSLHIHISFGLGFNESHGNFTTTGVSKRTHWEEKKIINKDIGLHTKQYEREWGPKVGWRKGRGGWVAVGEGICLEEPGYLLSPVPTFPPCSIPLPPLHRQVPVYPMPFRRH